MPEIHPTAIIDDQARLGEDVTVGAYTVIEGPVILEDGVRVGSHVVLAGNTRVGANTQIFPFAAVGKQPQDQKYKGEDTQLLIGANNIIREHATLHPGTAGGGGVTSVGNSCLIMVGAHVAHDCKLGQGVIMANNATLGGHVTVGDYAMLGGLSAIHQFVRIGRYAMIGGLSGSELDVIPYGSVMGNRAGLSGLNLIGIKRRGFSREQVHSLRTAYRLLFAEEGRFEERLADVAEMFPDNEAVMEIVNFVRAPSSRPLCQPRTSRVAA